MSSLNWQQDGPVRVLVIARPPINALDQESLDELDRALADAEANDQTRAVVITGGLDGIFCAGGDLRYWRRVPDGKLVRQAGHQVLAHLERLAQPTIAAINGLVIGDGLSLALACDLRIASEVATFRLPEVAHGFIPGWGLISRLVAMVGRANASHLLLTCEPIDATRALQIGLVDALVPADHLMPTAVRQAHQIAAFSATALHAAKCALHGDDEAQWFETIWGGLDWQEGVDALLAKRVPVYNPGRKGEDRP